MQLELQENSGGKRDLFRKLIENKIGFSLESELRSQCRFGVTCLAPSNRRTGSGNWES